MDRCVSDTTGKGNPNPRILHTSTYSRGIYSVSFNFHTHNLLLASKAIAHSSSTFLSSKLLFYKIKMASKQVNTAEIADESKRVLKCHGCKVSHKEHSWGTPGPHCTGDSKSVIVDTNMPKSEETLDLNASLTHKHREQYQYEYGESDEEGELAEELKALQLTEAALSKQARIKQMKKQIQDTRERVAKMKADTTSSEPNDAKSAEQSRTTPLDALLTAQGQSQAHASQLKMEGPRGHWNPINPHGPLSAPQDKDVWAMFLKPAQLAKGERVLRIIDFIDKIVQSADERTISELGTKKLVSYGPKKPKLENVTLAQRVIGNTRIFHTLLQGGKLPSIQDVQHYLAYTAKIMELSTKFVWTSVLKYDDEFRHIQAVYNYPWSFDSHHLHSVVLEPLSTFSGNRSVTSQSSQNTTITFANVTTEGKVICRNFNKARGCTLFESNFAHVCNRKIEGEGMRAKSPFPQSPSGQRHLCGGRKFKGAAMTTNFLTPKCKSLAGRIGRRRGQYFPRRWHFKWL